ncbi:MAG: cob(I)yrinic acid a,c-diamide adenosyltransferase [Hungatella sp.]
MAGCIHIYCGDGKGKTTAAIGLAVRAAGRGQRVLIARFLKTDDSGEVLSLARIPQITLLPCEKTFGFYRQMTDIQKAEAADYYQSLLLEACEKASTDSCRLLILDEILAVCHYGLVQSRTLLDFLKKKPKDLEVVLTGRNPSDELLEAADYVSEIQKKKHPYDRGISAREGIEY